MRIKEGEEHSGGSARLTEGRSKLGEDNSTENMDTVIIGEKIPESETGNIVLSLS